MKRDEAELDPIARRRAHSRTHGSRAICNLFGPGPALLSGGAAESFSEAVMADGPRAYWEFDETSGTTFTSLVNGHVLTLQGGGFTLGVTGFAGGRKALRSSGASGAGLTAPDGNQLIGGASALTIEAVLKVAAGASMLGMFLEGSEATPVCSIERYGAIPPAVYLGPSEVAWGNADPEFQIDTWSHLVCSWDGTNTFIMLNGAIVSAGTTPSFSLPANTTLCVMQRFRAAFASGSFGTAGDLDSLAIYRSALSQARAEAHWAALS